MAKLWGKWYEKWKITWNMTIIACQGHFNPFQSYVTVQYVGPQKWAKNICQFQTTLVITPKWPLNPKYDLYLSIGLYFMFIPNIYNIVNIHQNSCWISTFCKMGLFGSKVFWPSGHSTKLWFEPENDEYGYFSFTFILTYCMKPLDSNLMAFPKIGHVAASLSWISLDPK